MSRIRVAVVGAGHLGRIHARLLASLPDVELTAVVDPILRAAEEVAVLHGARPLTSHRDATRLADAAIIATPTVHHHAVGLELIRAGLHTFVEKPLAPSVRQAEELVAVAASHNRILQVGHVERFNPAFSAAASVGRPQYIEAVRTSGYTFRSTDIGAVLDLMIHDIDLALTLAQSDVERVEALGFSLLGKHEDMAQARLTFANGCVANLTASRTSFIAQRRMQVFGSRGFAALDFSAPSARLVLPSDTILHGGIDIDLLGQEEKQAIREKLFVDHLVSQDVPVEPRNAIQDELAEFIAAIRGQSAPSVDGRQALCAIAVAERILAAIADHRWNTESGRLCGPFGQPQLLPRSSQHRDAA